MQAHGLFLEQLKRTKDLDMKKLQKHVAKTSEAGKTRALELKNVAIAGGLEKLEKHPEFSDDGHTFNPDFFQPN